MHGLFIIHYGTAARFQILAPTQQLRIRTGLNPEYEGGGGGGGGGGCFGMGAVFSFSGSIGL